MKNNTLWTVLMLVIVLLMFGYQVFDYVRFRTAGSRFTASDGQALCERVQRLDSLPCRYLEKQ